MLRQFTFVYSCCSFCFGKSTDRLLYKNRDALPCERTDGASRAGNAVGPRAEQMPACLHPVPSRHGWPSWNRDKRKGKQGRQRICARSDAGRGKAKISRPPGTRRRETHQDRSVARQTILLLVKSNLNRTICLLFITCCAITN